MAAFLRRLGLSLATGVVFVYWSELVFWARPSPGTSLAGTAPTTIAYWVAAYLFLATVSAYRVSTPAAVFLAGALFGWFIEGVIVQTLVADLPLSISFTGLAWHASITVLLGWWLIPRWLRGDGRERRALAVLLVAVGAIYGAWATTWWIESPPPTPPLAFALYTLQTTLVLGTAYAISARLQIELFRPTRLEWAVLAGAVLTYFALVSVPSAPLSLVVLPPLVTLAWVGLRRLRHAAVDARPKAPVAPPHIAAYSILLMLPLAASTVYSIAWSIDGRPPAGVLIYIATTALGFILLAWSLGRALARRPRPRRPPEIAGGA
jgi:hypothetical protein